MLYKVAIAAEMGPVTFDHVLMLVSTTLLMLGQALEIRHFRFWAAFVQMLIHDSSGCMGMTTAGSGGWCLYLPLRKDVRIRVVVHVPAVLRPVERARLPRQDFTVVGAAPITV